VVPGRQGSNYLSQLRHIACLADDKTEVIKRASENGTTLEIVYLKPNDEKSRRVIKYKMVGEMEYRGKSYLGMCAFCLKRNEERVFRVDRILEMGQA
jgi:ATP-dependent DNA helicase PIF1